MLNFALTFLGLVAVAFIVYAGYLYVISGGDDGNMEKAKKIILYALIGILVILAAYAIVNTVIQNVGRGTGESRRSAEVMNPTPGGTIPGGVAVPGGPISPTDPAIQENLQSLVTVSGNGVQDFGSTAVATLEVAQGGITFGLNTQAQALLDFGDGTQGILNTIDNPAATLTHPFGEERTYPVRVVIENVQVIFPARKEIVVGGITADFNMNRAEISVGEPLRLTLQTQATVGSIGNFTWTCSGGAGCFSETSGRNANLTFSAPGQYDITLTVENVLGLSDSMTRTIRVIGGAPVANFSFCFGGGKSTSGRVCF